MTTVSKSKFGKISPNQLFFVLFVSRIVVTLTYVQTISVGILGTDFLISIALSYALTLLFSLPVVFCIKNGKNPLKNQIVSVLYSILYIWLSGVNISRFSYFASSRFTPNLSMIFFIFIICACALYCSSLGIEGISRFGSFCGVLLIVTVIMVMVFNFKNIEMLNYYPIYSNSTLDIVKNSFVMTSNSTEIILLLALSKRVNGDVIKPFVSSITASYFVIFLLIFFVIGVMGSSSSLQAYPIFSLFQLASVESISRLDALHISFWVLALLLKCSVLFYCSSSIMTKYKFKTKCIISAVLSLFVALFITEILSTKMVEISKHISVSSFAIFTVLIPLFSLIVSRSDKFENS